jgi:hypothetical protein
MTQVDLNTSVKIANSMVEGLYRQLKESGYNEEQIVALGAGLVRMARSEQFMRFPHQGIFSCTEAQNDDENGLLLVGYPVGLQQF